LIRYHRKIREVRSSEAGELADGDSTELAMIQGKFLISINDAPEIRELFKVFQIQEVPNRYSCHVSKVKKVTELLIRNY
jgi:hypothetical protein